MGDDTKIQWTDHTFNGWRGCNEAELPDGSPHPGCDNCYAKAMAKRNPGVLGTWGADGTRVMGVTSYWELPHKWNAAAARDGIRRRVFCQSIADVFEDFHGPIHHPNGEVFVRPYLDSENIRSNWHTCDFETWQRDAQGWQLVTLHDLRRELFKVIDATPWLDWQLLTKRPGNIRRMWPRVECKEYIKCNLGKPTGIICPNDSCDVADEIRHGHRNNVWLGTSISNQVTATYAVPEVLKCRGLSPVLFLSVEPLLGPVDFWEWLGCPDDEIIASRPGSRLSKLGRRLHGDKPQIDWLIAGGESGPHARRCHLDWLTSIIDQCREARVPAFVKQIGTRPVIDYYADSDFRESCLDRGGRILEPAGRGQYTEWKWPRDHYQPTPKSLLTVPQKDRHGGNPDEWPNALRVREFPQVGHSVSEP